MIVVSGVRSPDSRREMKMFITMKLAAFLRLVATVAALVVVIVLAMGNMSPASKTPSPEQPAPTLKAHALQLDAVPTLSA